MESQNHFYGHSAALAAYLGRSRPSHVSGLMQHGWTAVSPVGTHFRDFPEIGLPGHRSRRLLVWSHSSRAWTPGAEGHETTPIGAQFVYLVRAAGARPEPRDELDEVVLMPVHGIQTQRVLGDHAGLARLWREAEGPATACLYASDAADPEIADAYRSAGHRIVVLGDRMDPAFLWRLWTMLGRARRVVSNRLSTPVVYGAYLGADIGVYGDALRIEGEGGGENDQVRSLWPELHGEIVDRLVAAHLSGLELGASHVRTAPELEALLGWDGPPITPMLDYWSRSPLQRALVNVRRRSSSESTTSSVTPAAGHATTDATPERVTPAATLGWFAWFKAAASYLPRPLPRHIPRPGEVVDPIEVDAGDRQPAT